MPLEQDFGSDDFEFYCPFEALQIQNSKLMAWAILFAWCACVRLSVYLYIKKNARGR